MKLHILAVVVSAALISGCNGIGGERGRAVNAALAAFKHKNARLLTYVSRDEEVCTLGCSTDVCAALELGGGSITKREVVFVLVGGMDDQEMKPRGTYSSLNECKAHFERG